MVSPMLTIRLKRIGRTNDPAFRIVASEKARSAKSGHILELLGNYNPRTKEFAIDKERTLFHIKNGAQPSDTMHNLLLTKGIIEGKKINVLPKKTVPKVEAPEVKEEAPKQEEAASTPEVVESETAETPAEVAA